MLWIGIGNRVGPHQRPADPVPDPDSYSFQSIVKLNCTYVQKISIYCSEEKEKTNRIFHLCNLGAGSGSWWKIGSGSGIIESGETTHTTVLLLYRTSWLFSVSVGHFCLSGSRSGFPIRIQRPNWIRIRNAAFMYISVLYDELSKMFLTFRKKCGAARECDQRPYMSKN